MMRALTAMVFVAALSCTSAQAQQSNSAQVYVEITGFLAFDDKCKVLGPLERAALKANQAEILAGHSNAEVAPVKAAAANAATVGAAQSCTDAKGGQLKTGLKQLGNAQAAIWLARANAIAVSETSYADWAHDITTVGPRAAQLDAAVKNAYANASPELKSVMNQASSAMPRLLRMACLARKAVRTQTLRACPSLSSDEEKGVLAASPALDVIEAFVVSAGAFLDAHTPKPFEIGQIRDYYRWEQVGGFTSLTSLDTCKRGDLVIKVGPAVKEGSYTLTRLGSPDALGSVQVGNDGSDLILLNANSAARQAGIGALGTFKQCLSGP